jgi:eukaryotic-like serine/threonine-protein kinase
VGGEGPTYRGSERIAILPPETNAGAAMPPATEKIKAIFLAALDKAPRTERAAFLDEACADDASLRQRVEALLRAHDQADPLLDRPAAEHLDPERTRVPDGASAPPGATVAGRYKLLERIGEGGMGTVWVAEQTQPVRRKVALKLIKAGMDSKQVLNRFEAERQALALMDHPHIAKVLDGGTTEIGRPFFVMEYVKGVPLTTYCDGARLSVADRLRLFTQVCQAVQHAHQKGIIHRDLKPANILVCPYDGKPVPKVIDFGLAKAMQEPLTEHTMFTAHGMLLGTPLYMSPEQAEVNNLDVDTRSDVYALGVILYELLTGTTPLEHRRLKEASWLELLRLIKEEETPRPSARLSGSATLPRVAAQRQLEPVKLTRLVRGELDWIVLKALEKDRDRRYETANSFALDVQRYLAGESVLAAPPSASYRLRKFVRKHRAAFLMAAVILFLLLAGVAVSTWQAVRATEAEGEARLAERDARQAQKQAERDRDAKDLALQNEEQERKYAQAIADFVTNDFLALTSVEGQERFGRPTEAYPGKDTTLRQLLDRAAAKLDQRGGLDPRIEAELRWMIGVNYRGLGEAGRAIPFLERCVALRKKWFGPGHEETLLAQNSLAVAYGSAGKLHQALPLIEETLKLLKAQLGADHPHTLICMNNLASAYRDAGKLHQALPLFKETLKLAKARLGTNHSVTLACMAGLGKCYLAAGKPDQALPLFKETLRRATARLGADHSVTLACMAGLGGCYLAVGKPDQALPLLEETLRLRKARLGADHPLTFTSMNDLAGAYRDAGKPDQALALLEETLKLTKAKLRADDPLTLSSMNNLAAAYLVAGKPDQALPLLEETFRLTKARLGADHPLTLASMNDLAGAYRDAGKLDQALPLIEATLKLVKAKLGADHPHTLICMNNLATAYRDAGKLDQALPLYQQAAAGMEKRGFKHGDAGRIVKNLSDCHERLKQFDQAESWRRKWLAVVKERSGAQSVPYANGLAGLGLDLLGQQKWTDAEPVLRDCLALCEKQQPDAWTTFSVQSMLGGALLGQEKHAAAEPLLRKGYQGLKQRAARIPPRDKMRLTEAVRRLIALYEATGNQDEAARWRAELRKVLTP